MEILGWVVHVVRTFNPGYQVQDLIPNYIISTCSPVQLDWPSGVWIACDSYIQRVSLPKV
jgi:hypothetical protein